MVHIQLARLAGNTSSSSSFVGNYVPLDIQQQLAQLQAARAQQQQQQQQQPLLNQTQQLPPAAIGQNQAWQQQRSATVSLDGLDFFQPSADDRINLIAQLASSLSGSSSSQTSSSACGQENLPQEGQQMQQQFKR